MSTKIVNMVCIIVNAVFIFGLVLCLVLFCLESNFVNMAGNYFDDLVHHDSIRVIKTVNAEIRSYSIIFLIISFVFFSFSLFLALKGKRFTIIALIESIFLELNQTANFVITDKFSMFLAKTVTMIVVIGYAFGLFNLFLSWRERVAKNKLRKQQNKISASSDENQKIDNER